MDAGHSGYADELIATHRGYARALSAEVLRTLPRQVAREDLDAAAELGLVEAARAFDPSLRVLFKTFAYYRIRGAIYDALRKMTWFSKSLYDKYKFEIAANEYLADYHASPPAGDGEPALRRVAQITDTVASCYLLSLESERIDCCDGAAKGAEQQAIEQQTSLRLREALERLPEKNRGVLQAYYFEDKSLEQIGEGLGLSKSWVCRVHARSLEMLKEELAALGVGDPAMLHAQSTYTTVGAAAR
jgi:RNA polymerase sigma factor for flagellar operon FliA